MTDPREGDAEEKLLRSVALQNAKSILLARQRAEEELVRAKEALELKTEELDRSLAMMRATLESTTDGILVTDGGGTVTGFNATYVDMWRMPAEVVESGDHRRLLQFNSQQFADPRQFLAIVEGIYASSPSESHDLLELSDGRVFERFSRIQYVDERNVGRVWSFRDITTRRRAEDALRKQSEWLRVTLSSIGDAVITTDAVGVVTSLNPVAEELTGWTEEEARGIPLEAVFRIVNEESRRPAENPAQRALSEGQIVGLANHTVLIARDGIERAIDDSAAPIRDEHGHVGGVVLIFRDITERRRAEVRLRQSVETTGFLAHASATLAELADYESTLQRVAGLAVPSFADWCAVDVLDDGSIRRLAVAHADPAKVQLAHELFRRYPPRPSDPSGVAKVLREGVPEWLPRIPEAFLESVGGDEEYRSILRQLGLKSYICVPLRSRSGTLGVLTFVTAESGRIYDASDLAAAEDLAARAVIAIENSNLLAALKESDRRKDEFLAILAHELRNPLAPVRNAVHILRAKAPALPEVLWATDVIDRQVHQMSRLVDDLLDVSRIAGGKLQLRKARVDLASVVNSAIEASRPLIDKWSHELIVEMPPEPISLDADLTRLSQVLLNLLNNAAKYTDKGGRIWLTVEREGEHVLVRVKDTGIGIPAEMLPRIFGMFTQVDRSLERAEGGLGIGLTLVQRLVELHGGAVEARSEGPGKGSEFIVRLPIAPDLEPGKRRGPAAAAEPLSGNSTRRILIVDDNRDAAETLGLLLRNLGHQVHTAHDGLEAVAAAAEFQPDVVLLDIGMPRLNGYDAARQIREQRGHGVLLIAVTGWGQEEDRRRSAEAGFDHHLTKPVNLGALTTLLAAPRV